MPEEEKRETAEEYKGVFEDTCEPGVGKRLIKRLLALSLQGSPAAGGVRETGLLAQN